MSSLLLHQKWCLRKFTKGREARSQRETTTSLPKGITSRTPLGDGLLFTHTHTHTHSISLEQLRPLPLDTGAAKPRSYRESMQIAEGGGRIAARNTRSITR